MLGRDLYRSVTLNYESNFKLCLTLLRIALTGCCLETERSYVDSEAQKYVSFHVCLTL